MLARESARGAQVPRSAQVFIGTPLFLLELAMGQRFSLGATHSYMKLHPRFKGVGCAGTFMAYMTLLYYNVILRAAQGCRTVSHFREAISVSLFRVSPGVPILRGFIWSSVYEFGVPPRGDHLSSRSLLKRVDECFS